MRIVAKETVDNSKSHKKTVSKVQAPNVARKNKKQTSRTSIKAPSIPTKIKKPTMPTVGSMRIISFSTEEPEES